MLNINGPTRTTNLTGSADISYYVAYDPLTHIQMEFRRPKRGILRTNCGHHQRDARHRKTYQLGRIQWYSEPNNRPWETYVSPHNDITTHCNYNGEQLLGICAEYGLWITNTFCVHITSQTHTWYKWNDLNTPSHIVFILTRTEHRRNVTDTNAKRKVSK